MKWSAKGVPGCAALAFLVPPIAGAQDAPISLHPANGRYFIFRGQPTVLVTSGEHYGAVLNLDFDYVPYLNELQSKGLNYTRIFSGAYVEMPGAFGIQKNTLAPASGRFICPWARSATPGYKGGGNKFDLSQWDSAYLARLKDFLAQAGSRGIVVELSLFCPFYNADLWTYSPMHKDNNVNGTADIAADQVYTLSSPYLGYHDAMVQKLVTELKDYDNLFYEICNEPYFGGVTLDWQAHIAQTIVAAESGFAHRHLIAQNIANGSTVIANPDPAVSIFNFHYCAPPDAVAQNYGLNKVIGFDESGFAGSADATYRMQGWNFIIAGGGLFNNLDYSFTVDHEDGDDTQSAPGGGSPALRTQLGILKSFIHGFDFIGMAPNNAVVKSTPGGAQARALAKEGESYAIYLSGGSQGDLVVEIPAGTYRAEWVNTKTGAIDRSEELVHGGGPRTLSSPAYSEDVALRILAAGAGNLSPGATISDPGNGATFVNPARVTIRATASDPDGQVTKVDFYEGTNLIGTDANAADGWHCVWSGVQAGTYVLTAVATDDGGKTGASPAVTIYVGSIPAGFWRGIDLNGPAVTIEGETWLSHDAAALLGFGTSNASSWSGSYGFMLDPAADADTRTMLEHVLYRPAPPNGQGFRMTQAIPNGTYRVFLWTLENYQSNFRDNDVRLEGVQVATAIGDLPLGRWAKYGPYETTVADGVLDIDILRHSKGDPCMAGLAIHRVAGLDSDGDGIADSEEAAHGTDPFDQDTDGDGMADGDEVAFGFDPTDGDEDSNGVPDGQDDWDSDGVTNQDELAARTPAGDVPGGGGGGEFGCLGAIRRRGHATGLIAALAPLAVSILASRRRRGPCRAPAPARRAPEALG